MLEFLRGIGESVGGWLYVIAGGLAFAEAAVMVGVVLPGETALLVAGFAAHEGIIALVPMIVVAVVCAVAGDSVGYEVGRLVGPRLQASRVGRLVGEHRWQATEDFLRRHGGEAVLLGRGTALLRALVPGMAGMARMPYLRTFLPWNAVGGILWGGGCVLLGYVFALSLETVARYLAWGPIPVVVLVAGVLIWREARRRK
ncbi:DedA family protein [Actinomycetospora soli]|uniref:DedA family protein n=1 Tax=Actinomycetospora soli TaxID=2893887 RepID=UPI001E2FBF58|nr:DedA family protein [Actinomycetospora soli]MCD2186306.1 DedA family protein [Actinomycetospora soli]